MSTLTLDRLAFPRSRPLRVIAALSAREGRRLLRHPIWIGGAILSLAFFGLLTWHLAPVLHRDDTQIAGSLFPLAAATLVTANMAALRTARDGTQELYAGLSTTAATRTVAHLFSVAWAVAGSMLLTLVMFGYLLVAAPVGTPRVAEVATGPLLVALLGVVGIALARLKPHVALAPIAVVAVAAVEIMIIQPVVGLDMSTTRTPWLGPWVPISITGGVPPELVIRPAGWHILYLVGLMGVAAGAALARDGVRRAAITLAVASLVAAVLAGVAQLAGPSRAQVHDLVALVNRPEEFQVCEERHEITYCAYPAYAPWIERWAKPIEGVLARVPAEARPSGLVVRQIFGPYFEGVVDVPPAALRNTRPWTDSEVITGYEWGRGAGEGQFEMGLALYTAARSVGLPTERDEIVLRDSDVRILRRDILSSLPSRRRERYSNRRLSVGDRWSSCHAHGQARAAVAMWLAGAATPGTEATMRAVASEFHYGIEQYKDGTYGYIGPYSPMYPANSVSPWLERVSMADAEFRYGVRMLDRPEAAIESLVDAHWPELRRPATDIAVLLDLLGFEPLPTVAEQKAALPDDYEAYGRIRTGGYLKGTIPCR